MSPSTCRAGWTAAPWRHCSRPCNSCESRARGVPISSSPAGDAEKQNVDVYVGNESPETIELALAQPDLVVLLQYPDEGQPYAYNLTATDYAGFLRKRDSTSGPGGDLGYYIWLSESKVSEIVEVYYP